MAGCWLDFLAAVVVAAVVVVAAAAAGVDYRHHHVDGAISRHQARCPAVVAEPTTKHDAALLLLVCSGVSVTALFPVLAMDGLAKKEASKAFSKAPNMPRTRSTRSTRSTRGGARRRGGGRRAIIVDDASSDPDDEDFVLDDGDMSTHEDEEAEEVEVGKAEEEEEEEEEEPLRKRAKQAKRGSKANNSKQSRTAARSKSSTRKKNQSLKPATATAAAAAAADENAVDLAATQNPSTMPRQKAERLVKELAVCVTGARPGEIVKGIRETSRNAIMKLHGCLLPPSQAKLDGIRLYPDLWARFVRSLGSLDFFTSMSLKEREQWIRDHQIQREPHMSDFKDALAEVRAIGTSAFATELPEEKLRLLMQGNPDRKDSLWPLHRIGTWFPPKNPWSQAKNHSLIFLRSYWAVQNPLPTATSFTGPVVDVISGVCHAHGLSNSKHPILILSGFATAPTTSKAKGNGSAQRNTRRTAAKPAARTATSTTAAAAAVQTASPSASTKPTKPTKPTASATATTTTTTLLSSSMAPTKRLVEGEPGDVGFVLPPSAQSPYTIDAFRDAVSDLCDLGDFDTVRASICRFNFASLLSLMQKLLRYRPQFVSLPSTRELDPPFPARTPTAGAQRFVRQHVPVTAALAACCAQLACHSGVFVPDIQRFVSGVEGLAKRGVVTVLEDAHSSNEHVLLQMMSVACIVQRIKLSGFRPPLSMVVGWIKTLAKAIDSKMHFNYAKRMERWRRDASNEPPPFYLEACASAMQAVSALLDDCRSFKGDLAIARWVGAGQAEAVGGREQRPTFMPLEHSIDQHCTPDFIYHLTPSCVRAVAKESKPLPSTPFRPHFAKVFREVTGVNTRKTEPLTDHATAEPAGAPVPPGKARGAGGVSMTFLQMVRRAQFRCFLSRFAAKTSTPPYTGENHDIQMVSRKALLCADNNNNDNDNNSSSSDGGGSGGDGGGSGGGDDDDDDGTAGGRSDSHGEGGMRRVRFTINDSWLAGMAGVIEVKIKDGKKHVPCLVTLHPSNPYTLVVVRRPARGMDSAIVSDAVLLQAQRQVRRQMVAKGVVLNKCSAPVSLLKGAALWLRRRPEEHRDPALHTAAVDGGDGREGTGERKGKERRGKNKSAGTGKSKTADAGLSKTADAGFEGVEGSRKGASGDDDDEVSDEELDDVSEFEYALQLADGTVVLWEDVSVGAVDIPVFEAMPKRLETALMLSGPGMMAGAFDELRCLFHKVPLPVLQRMKTYLSRNARTLSLNPLNIDGGGSKQAVTLDDAETFQMLLRMSVLFPSALQKAEHKAYAFTVECAPLLWAVRRHLLDVLLLRQQHESSRAIASATAAKQWPTIHDTMKVGGQLRQPWSHQVGLLGRMVG